MRYGSFVTTFSSLVLTLILFSSLHLAGAQVMGSTNYRIQSDSINVGGGLSSSTNYTQESTVGEAGSGESSSETFTLRAGYQQMQEVYIAVSGATTTVLSPALGGISGGTSNGSTTVTVVTDSPSGYSLSIASESSPAMQSGANTLADYDTVGAAPDFNFLTDASDAHLGFTPEGSDVALRFQDSGGVCNSAGTDTSLACWDGLSTTSEVIAEGVGANHPDGATTTIHFRVGIGGGAQAVPGVYTATTTVTAVPL